jgi:hypothetical protein
MFYLSFYTQYENYKFIRTNLANDNTHFMLTVNSVAFFSDKATASKAVKFMKYFQTIENSDSYDI